MAMPPLYKQMLINLGPDHSPSTYLSPSLSRVHIVHQPFSQSGSIHQLRGIAGKFSREGVKNFKI